jgi:hypothetical protein
MSYRNPFEERITLLRSDYPLRYLILYVDADPCDGWSQERQEVDFYCTLDDIAFFKQRFTRAFSPLSWALAVNDFHVWLLLHSYRLQSLPLPHELIALIQTYYVLIPEQLLDIKKNRYGWNIEEIAILEEMRQSQKRHEIKTQRRHERQETIDVQVNGMI